MIKISAIIIAKNEEKMIINCLSTLRFCDELLIINNGSIDKTAELAEEFGAKVINFSHPSFARLRNEGLKRAKNQWLFYIDADERVTPQLAQEILVNLETTKAAALTLLRKNICYGYQLQHGGWEKDFVTRIFNKNQLKKWTGDIHESPIFIGESIKLKTPLLHLTHRSTSENLLKTQAWTKIEAELLFKSSIKKVTFTTILRKGIMEFIRRAYFKKGYKDALVGLIEALVQAINKMLIYIQVWEMQQKPTVDEKYQQYEQEIMNQWRIAKNK